MDDTDSDIQAVEASLAEALDLIADGEDRRANILLDRGIQKLRLLSVGAHRLPALRLWALTLSAQEEWEQALLKYEQILSVVPDDEDALWQSALILLRSLERPEPARALIADRLLPINRTSEYEEALRECEVALGIPRG
jgi:tetratricopeptide (TPR) repeat protein